MAGLGIAALIATAAVVADTRSMDTVVALGGGQIPVSALETWTSVGSPLEPGSPLADDCAATMGEVPGITDVPVTVVNSNLRGEVASVILAKDEYTAWCVGTGAGQMYTLLESPGFIPTSIADGAIDLGPSGGRIPPDGYGFAAGHAGPGVARVTLKEDGINVTATVENGWWAAWWPSDDETLNVDGTITVETSNGETTEYPAHNLQLP